jgi:hypothetical protein
LHLVLDSNEYILAFGGERERASEDLLLTLALHPNRFIVSICRPILEEVGRHITPWQLSELYAFLNALDVGIDERWLVPFEFVERYIAKGLKRGDAFIAGYTEWIGADCLVSENRADIVDRSELFSFSVLTAEKFLKKHA